MPDADLPTSAGRRESGRGREGSMTLSQDLSARLAALRERGCEVEGPTASEDTSPTGGAAADEHRDRAWQVVLRCNGPDGGTISAEGSGQSPDEAARAAIAALTRSAPAIAGG